MGKTIIVKESVQITSSKSSSSKFVDSVSNVCFRACETFGEGRICWFSSGYSPKFHIE